MINISEVIETNKMIEKENLDVRTITMGINLLDCAATEVDVLCDNIYKKITRLAKNLVKTGEDISKEFGVPSSTSASLLLLLPWWVALPARQQTTT